MLSFELYRKLGPLSSNAQVVLNLEDGRRFRVSDVVTETPAADSALELILTEVETPRLAQSEPEPSYFEAYLDVERARAVLDLVKAMERVGGGHLVDVIANEVRRILRVAP